LQQPCPHGYTHSATGPARSSAPCHRALRNAGVWRPGLSARFVEGARLLLVPWERRRPDDVARLPALRRRDPATGQPRLHLGDLALLLEDHRLGELPRPGIGGVRARAGSRLSKSLSCEHGARTLHAKEAASWLSADAVRDPVITRHADAERSRKLLVEGDKVSPQLGAAVFIERGSQAGLTHQTCLSLRHVFGRL
jgi:hypothetical protein